MSEWQWDAVTRDSAGREDLRGEWYREYDPYSVFAPRPPRLYWLGMAVSAVWVVAYLLIYPSIPLVFAQTHWKGIGMPGGCQPWTAICEMQQAEYKLNAVRGRYLDKLRVIPVADLAEDQEMVEFVSRAGRVVFADSCAGCHGQLGTGIAKFPSLAPALNDTVWLHGGDVQSIQTSIRNPSVHPAGLIRRNDETATKILAVFVSQLPRQELAKR